MRSQPRWGDHFSWSKALAERTLNAETDHHLAGEGGTTNSRNGYGRESVVTDSVVWPLKSGPPCSRLLSLEETAGMSQKKHKPEEMDTSRNPFAACLWGQQRAGVGATSGWTWGRGAWTGASCRVISAVGVGLCYAGEGHQWKRSYTYFHRGTNQRRLLEI